ncbi:hypothetical protein K8R33_03895 [archaeon]|nr:hypothetical protein [archaeon]
MTYNNERPDLQVIDLTQYKPNFARSLYIHMNPRYDIITLNKSIGDKSITNSTESDAVLSRMFVHGIKHVVRGALYGGLVAETIGLIDTGKVTLHPELLEACVTGALIDIFQSVVRHDMS